MYIYEHKLLYQFIYQFLEYNGAKEHLYCLEIGLYINMYKLEKKKHLLVTIQNLCKENKLPEYNSENEEKIDMYIIETLEVIYNNFTNSQFFNQFKESLQKNARVLFL